jgi:hypothetical protein
MTSNGYVASGAFKSDLESALGSLAKKDEPDEREDWFDEQLAMLPEPMAAEVDALYTLYNTYKIPSLCKLDTGGFCSLPAQNDEPRETVLEDWFDGDAAATDVAMTSVEIFRASGSPSIVVSAKGLGAICEDPWGYDAFSCSLEEFLKMLIQADAVAIRSGVEEARRVAEPLIGKRFASLLVRQRAVAS